MPAISDVQVLSFDCYGTLIDWEQGLADALMPLVGPHRPDIDREQLLAAYAAAEAAVEHEAPGRYPEVLARAATRMAAALGVPLTDADRMRVADSVPMWPAFPDSAEALGRLKRRFRLIILSNVDNASFAASRERLGVIFDEVITAEDLGFYKPDPRAFDALLACVARLGVPPGHHVHVAQSLYHDHEPAQAAGLPTVWINRRHGRPGWGATPPPASAVTPTWEYPTLAAFATAWCE